MLRPQYARQSHMKGTHSIWGCKKGSSCLGPKSKALKMAAQERS